MRQNCKYLDDWKERHSKDQAYMKEKYHQVKAYVLDLKQRLKDRDAQIENLKAQLKQVGVVVVELVLFCCVWIVLLSQSMVAALCFCPKSNVSTLTVSVDLALIHRQILQALLQGPLCSASTLTL